MCAGGGGNPSRKMRRAIVLLVVLACSSCVLSEDPYVYFNWVIEKGVASPLGIKQDVYLYIYLNPLHN